MLDKNEVCLLNLISIFNHSFSTEKYAESDDSDGEMTPIVPLTLGKGKSKGFKGDDSDYDSDRDPVWMPFDVVSLSYLYILQATQCLDHMGSPKNSEKQFFAC